MDKEFKEEMKHFNISIDDIEPSTDIFGAIEQAAIEMRMNSFKDRLEVILNGNLIETKDKYTGYRTIFGCRVSYDNLPKDISFIVREDTKPSYEELQDRIDEAIVFIETFNKTIKNDGRFGSYVDFMTIPKGLSIILKGSDKE